VHRCTAAAASSCHAVKGSGDVLHPSVCNANIAQLVDPTAGPMGRGRGRGRRSRHLACACWICRWWPPPLPEPGAPLHPPQPRRRAGRHHRDDGARVRLTVDLERAARVLVGTWIQKWCATSCSHWRRYASSGLRKFGVTPALVAMILHVVVSAGVKVSGVEVRVERSEKKSTPSIQNYSRRFTSLEIGFRARSHH
jgi:hypothetical protein